MIKYALAVTAHFIKEGGGEVLHHNAYDGIARECLPGFPPTCEKVATTVNGGSTVLSSNTQLSLITQPSPYSHTV